MSRRLTPMALALAAALPSLATASTLETVVVTAARESSPLTTEIDAKQPRQPLPAHDGADYLKTIPGFSVIRKGGSDGDPVLRGMAGSRLNILLDGEHILGGCGNRMDPPTAYVFPEAYDRIIVTKGPQTVLNGPGNLAGTVQFERTVKPLAGPVARGYGSVMEGSFGRHDEVADFLIGNPSVQLRGTATNSHMNDYRDGDGNRVHSRYNRWSANAGLAVTPDADTVAEITAATSDGNAAYADRSMDGVLFKRENVGLRFEKRRLSPLVEKVEAQWFYNYIDHVMDNYSMRANSAMRMVSNPDRKTVGGRALATLRLSDATQLVAGVDAQQNQHTLRTTTNYAALPRVADAQFSNAGLFGELTHHLGERQRLIGGLRIDRWEANDQRASGVTAGQRRTDTLSGGFGRYEQDLAALPATAYVGLGHAQRFPDYWELISAGKQSETGTSAFGTRPEKSTQLDAGLVLKGASVTASLSGFVNRIDDFILIDSRFPGKVGTLITRNVDAASWGGEAGISWAFAPNWKADASLAYVRGNNRSDGTPLAQLPPLETRLGLSYADARWSVGGLLRVVARQDRFDLGAGNIVGQDLGASGGFAVFSVHAGFRPQKGILVSGGIDNLFDRQYTEHISKAGATIGGIAPQTLRLAEPGRTVWIKATINFD